MSLPKRLTGLQGLAVLALAVVLGGFLVLWQFEWHPPRIEAALEGNALGRRPFVVAVHDRGKGLRQVSVSLAAAGQSVSLYQREFEAAVESSEIPVQIDPAQHGLKDGPAVLTVTARDRSYWGFFRGNRTEWTKEVALDFTPPLVELIDGDRYLTQGGTGFVTYRTSPDTERSEIRIDRYSFPGYGGHLPDPRGFLAFFSHPYDVPVSQRAVIVAEDRAGNTREFPLDYAVRPLKYRESDVPISDDFIRYKIGPLLADAGGDAGSPRERFLKVNRDMRRANAETITRICQDSAPKKLWSGRFRQLANSSVEAYFADHRSYFYRNEKIDEARHLGYDLAVTRQYPVGAANRGSVTFAGPLGIYGNTVILDHGFGLCTLYSHLSSVAVKPGDAVETGTTLGRTGETGLALGDHLHYGVYIQGVAVLPLEWWDAKWVADNVAGKLARKPSG